MATRVFIGILLFAIVGQTHPSDWLSQTLDKLRKEKSSQGLHRTLNQARSWRSLKVICQDQRMQPEFPMACLRFIMRSQEWKLKAPELHWGLRRMLQQRCLSDELPPRKLPFVAYLPLACRQRIFRHNKDRDYIEGIPTTQP